MGLAIEGLNGCLAYSNPRLEGEKASIAKVKVIYKRVRMQMSRMRLSTSHASIASSPREDNSMLVLTLTLSSNLIWLGLVN